MSPVRNRIGAGSEPFLVFVGEGLDQRTDLFAVPAGGGSVVQVTFTPPLELHPALTPLGDRVAFVRVRDTLPGTPQAVVVMNLITGNEVQGTLPPEAGRVRAVAWSNDLRRVLLRTEHGDWGVPLAPDSGAARALAAPEAATADTLLSTWLGEPRFARALTCPHGGICAIGPSGDTSVVAPTGTDPLRWGSDSMAWFDGDNLLVRSLGPGRERRVAWIHPPAHPRQGSYTPGPAATDSIPR